MRKGDVFIQINQITIQIYVRSYDISVINPFIEENMFLRKFDLTCISLFRALCKYNLDHFRLQLNKYIHLVKVHRNSYWEFEPWHTIASTTQASPSMHIKTNRCWLFNNQIILPICGCIWCHWNQIKSLLYWMAWHLFY